MVLALLALIGSVAGGAGTAPPAIVAVPAPPAPPEAPAPPPVDPARLTAARALVDALLPPASRQALFERVLTVAMGNMLAVTMRQQHLEQLFALAPELRDVFGRFLQRERDLALADLDASEPKLLDAYAQAYARRFTADELGQLHSFFTSALGTKYVLASAAVLTDPTVNAWSREIVAREEQRKPAELQRLREEIAPILAKHHVADGAS